MLNVKFHLGDVMSLTLLPIELTYKIFSFMEPQSLGTFCSVNKQFNQWIDNDLFWKDRLPAISFPKDISAKKYIESQAIVSFNAVIKRIQSFVEKHINEKDKNCSFKVSFPLNTNFNIEFNWGFKTTQNVFDIEDSCIFLKKLEGESGEPSITSHSCGNFFQVAKLQYPWSDPLNRDILSTALEALGLKIVKLIKI